MTAIERMRHAWVTHVPEILEDGVLYVSLKYGTAAHRCCCGCGNEVITPLSPVDWCITFDGETVTLDPSVGSWGLPCRSHYWITEGRVEWARAWTAGEVAAGRARSVRRRREYEALRRAADAVPRMTSDEVMDERADPASDDNTSERTKR